MPRPRPADRKQHILAAAAARFFALGYHQVGMADIATEVCACRQCFSQ
jgi:AcrR family transcriptional regulator